MKFKEIKRFPQIYYHVDIFLDHIPRTIERYCEEYGLDLSPDFQRDYVWSEEQKSKYIEFLLKDPSSGKEIYFNHPGWMKNFKGNFVIVDGKQRLDAVLGFFKNEVKAFGYLYKDFVDVIPTIGLSFNVAVLQTRKEVLQWYLDFNTGGTYHTKEEIERVKMLIEHEDKKEV